ncbi:MbtH protein [Pseudomonas umsongensis]|nr:MbtH protein [Pseudomonas umsongensis]
MSLEMTNPFEIESGIFYVLVNNEGQHSLWPDCVATPAGWQRVFGPDSRDNCLSFIGENWIDLKPKSLI